MIKSSDYAILIREQYINGSVLECKTHEDFEKYKTTLFKLGWTELGTLENLSIYYLKRDGKCYWYTLVAGYERG